MYDLLSYLPGLGYRYSTGNPNSSNWLIPRFVQALLYYLQNVVDMQHGYTVPAITATCIYLNLGRVLDSLTRRGLHKS
jgi:hypothetical protein